MERRVLITGANGMVGRQLMKLLPQAVGVDFHVQDVPRVEWLDLSDTTEVVSFLKDNAPFDWVFHLAGMRGAASIGRSRGLDFLVNNVKPTIGLIEGLVQSGFKGRLLDVSSIGIYPGNRDVFIEYDTDGPPHSSDFYGGHSKRFCELLCAAAREQHALDFVVGRPTAIFGPYDTAPAESAMVINALIKRLEAGEDPLILRGNPNAKRDFIYAPECARGLIAVIERGRSGEAYNVATGQAIAIKDVASALCELYGRSLIYQPGRDVGPSVRVMSTAKAEAELGFKTGFSKQQLEETAQHYRMVTLNG